MTQFIYSKKRAEELREYAWAKWLNWEPETWKKASAAILALLHQSWYSRSAQETQVAVQLDLEMKPQT